MKFSFKAKSGISHGVQLSDPLIEAYLNRSIVGSRQVRPSRRLQQLFANLDADKRTVLAILNDHLARETRAAS
jgi:DNA topoisomerase IB